MARSKTIQIFLKDSDPNGVKIAELSNSSAKVYVIPKKQTDFASSRVDLNSPALYLLFDDERTSVYIGECENFNHRIKNHAVNKNFLEWAVVVVGAGAGLDKAEVKFLESHVVCRAVDAGRFDVMNKTSPNLNNLHEFRRETILDFFADVELLLNTLGFNVFEPLSDVEPELPKDRQTKPIKDIREFDTIVSPCRGDGLKQAFIEKNAWWAVRIGQQNIPKLKYVALYEVAPISAIRYYAKITKIEPFEDMPGKYIIHHDGDIKTLENPVVLGEDSQLSLYGSRYYQLDDIINSTTLSELTQKTFGVEN